ncbi:MAG: pseudouridine synthase [Eubacteriales bacterium]|nr:pseudouridine synthase [Eubacteriales bacterium]
MEDMRLQKYLANAGITSRRKAEELILQGRVSVNGSIADKLGSKVSPGDVVVCDGREVKLTVDHTYIMMNKPKGYITTAKEQFSRPSVMDLLRGEHKRLYPVGRLDYNTSGLLLMTDDGDLAQKLTHPSYEVHKSYSALIKGIPPEGVLKKFEEGLDLDGETTAPAKIKIKRVIEDQTCVVEIQLREGKNRQVRRMCEAIGFPVLSLKRISIGPLRIGSLEEGQYRHLTKTEEEMLKKLSG